MNLYSIRSFRQDTKSICEYIRNTGKEAIITFNGKPTCLVMDISKDDYETVMRAVKQAKAMIAFNKAKKAAAENGHMTESEIEEEIKAARDERREED